MPEQTQLEVVVNTIEKDAPSSWKKIIDLVYENRISYPESIELDVILASAERLGLIHDVGEERWSKILRYELANAEVPVVQPKPYESDFENKGG